MIAIPGGFVDVGESVEEAVVREVKEETSISLDIDKIEQFRIYSDPSRDKRRHTVSSVFRCVVQPDDVLQLKRGDDAKSVFTVPLKDVLTLNFGFDHSKILSDYIKQYHPQLAVSLKILI